MISGTLYRDEQKLAYNMLANMNFTLEKMLQMINGKPGCLNVVIIANKFSKIVDTLGNYRSGSYWVERREHAKHA